MTKYQAAINEACYQMCKEDGSLIFNRGKLLSLAREKIHSDGYNYSKKASRSQVFGCRDEKKKRKYVHQEVRQTRIKELSESILSQKETIQFLQQQKVKYSNTEKFLEAAEINKSILEENVKTRKLELELEKLNAKETRSKAYQTKKKQRIDLTKKTSSSSTSDDTDITSSGEEPASNDNNALLILPKLQRSSAIRSGSITTSTGRTHLISNDHSTADNEIPAEDPAVFAEDEDPTNLQSYEKSSERQVISLGDSTVLGSDTSVVSDKEQPFLG